MPVQISPKTKNRSRKPLRLDLPGNLWDRKVDELSSKGLFAATIAQLTGLSLCQTRYRIGKFGCSPLAYRRGESKEAQQVIGEVNAMLRQINGLHRKLPQ